MMEAYAKPPPRFMQPYRKDTNKGRLNHFARGKSTGKAVISAFKNITYAARTSLLYKTYRLTILFLLDNIVALC